jgi:DnaJ-domain-containing protein 1
MKRGGLQGEVLVGMDILTEEEMTEALRAQADEKLFQIFEWSGGTYRFDKGAELQRANALGIDRSPANLILRGVRERFPAERITEYLRDHADCFVAPGESPYYRFQEVDIEPEHRTLLESLDGTQRLSEFVDAPDDLRRAICAFVSIGLIELRRQITHNPHRVASPQGARENDADATDDGVRAELAAMAERFESQTLFEILGVDPDADEDRIRGAYEDLGKRTHPDRFRTSTEPVRELAEDVFARISRAYETLVNPRRRGEYVLDQRREEREQRKVEDSKKAIRADSEFRRGEALLGARSYEESLVCFGRALELYPEEGDYYVHYGWALFLCHPDEIAIAEEAIEHIRRGLSVATHRDKAYLYMGRLYKALGRPDIAERLFVRAARIQPKCHEAMRELRLIQMRREKRKGLIGRLLRR